MNVIVLSGKNGQMRSVRLPKRWPWLLAFSVFVLPILLGVGAYLLAASNEFERFVPTITDKFSTELQSQRRELVALQQESQERFTALTIQLADAQARLVRLDALGERLLEVAEIESSEFDFGANLALGGPEVLDESGQYGQPSFISAIDHLLYALERRERQLEIMDSLLANRQFENQTYLSGRPVNSGWMSSRYGRRSDPFSGRLTWHRGVDFAAPTGTPIKATGAGVVTYSDDRGAYGLTVEISHGDNLVTRYAHASKLKVNVGDIVRAGDVIALVGSTGRSTGPHLHYEVLKDGRQVNPMPYIQRASR